MVVVLTALIVVKEDGRGELSTVTRWWREVEDGEVVGGDSESPGEARGHLVMS